MASAVCANAQITYSDNRYFVAAHYIGILNRDAEYNGYYFHVNRLNAGLDTRTGKTTDFLASAEFQLHQTQFVAGTGHPCVVPPLNQYNPNFKPPNDHAQWVAHLYWNVFGRCADPGGLQFHTQILYGDHPTIGQLSRPQVANNFMAGAEFSLRYSHRINAFITAIDQPGIVPTAVEVNLSFVPLDFYQSLNAQPGSGQPLVRNCPANVNVRDCFISLVNGSTQAYRPQSVTGVRFFFGSVWHSTALDSAGNVRPQWRSNLRLFLGDLKSQGINRVTPTPAYGPHDGPYTPNPNHDRVMTYCGVTKLLTFRPWLPYALDPSDGGSDGPYPDRTCGGKSYEQSPPTPNDIFGGWNRFVNVVDAVLAEARTASLVVDAFDFYNETNLDAFSVYARTLYDNTRNFDALGAVRNKMSLYGFDPNRALVSVSQEVPSPANYDCGSWYGDSAMLLNLSNFFGALSGPAGRFGNAPKNWTGNLPCSAPNVPVDYPQQNMSALPVSYPIPTVIDVHSQTVYPTPGETATWAQKFYSNVWSMLSARNMTGSKVVFGETNPVWGEFCDVWTATQASAHILGYQQQGGYKRSTLFQNAAANVVMRPWHRTEHGFTMPCVANPNLINPPFNAYGR